MAALGFLSLWTWLATPLVRVVVHADQAQFFRVVGPVATTITDFNTDGYVTWTNVVTNTTFIVQTAQSLSSQGNWEDYIRVPVTNLVTTHRLFDLHPPVNMAFIPAGSFIMGNCMNTNEGYISELPLHTVDVTAFYIDRYLVTKSLWNEAMTWGERNGYNYYSAGFGKAADHPVCSIRWYDMVKWCNARSQKEGLEPCYYTNAELTAVYKTGEMTPYVKWDANGYRLPTEAEWEKAARGGLSGHRFPWGDTISEGQANYYSFFCNSYDLSNTGYNSTFYDRVYPYTNPVGSFAPNGYGLYDMAGNVQEWCWDVCDYNYYTSSPSTDPHGPTTDSFRVLRGGSWDLAGFDARCARRDLAYPTDYGQIGFRCVRGL